MNTSKDLPSSGLKPDPLLPKNRERIIVRTSFIGIITNLLLSGFKVFAGLLSHSIATLLDAVNNLSDALSSVITIIGAFLAGKKPDKKHPLGHGRIEYLSAMIISAVVLYAGITSMIESIKKIIHPETADYSVLSLTIIAVSVLVKILLGNYVKRQGLKVHSTSLVASGSDALFDAILSASVLISAFLFLLTKINLEAYIAGMISLFIIKAGLSMLSDTMNDILGQRLDPEYLGEIKNTICEQPEVEGAYDLILHNYGPDRYIGSVHVEVPATMNADELDHLERNIVSRVLEKHGVLLTGISIYATNSKDTAVVNLRSQIYQMVRKHDGVLQIHGFHLDKKEKRIMFDIIIDFERQDREEIFQNIRKDLECAFPDYQFILTMDLDVL